MSVEKSFVCLLLNKPEVIKLLQIKPKYLLDPFLRKLTEYVAESYSLHNTILLPDIVSKYKDFDLQFFNDILNSEINPTRDWETKLKYYEETILKEYKLKVIKDLNKQLETKEITYEKFTDNIKKISDITIGNDLKPVTAKELREVISTKDQLITLNSFNKLNSTLRLVKGDFVIIGATTGKGKSAFALNLMNDLMSEYQCIYFNMEMSKSSVYNRLVSIASGVPIDMLKEPTEHQKGLIDNALKHLELANVYVEHKQTDINKIRSMVAKLKDKSKHTILFIDHIGLMQCDDKKTLYEKVTEVAKVLRQICLDYDCTIISASQLNRGAYHTDDINISMLKDSGEIENSASKVMLLYADKDNDKEDDKQQMIIEIAKNRDGRTGLIKMEYKKKKQIFKEKL